MKLTPPPLDLRYWQATAIQANLYADPNYDLAHYWTLVRERFTWDTPHQLVWLCRQAGGLPRE